MLLLLAGSCLLPEPRKLCGSAVQEEFSLLSLGTKPWRPGQNLDPLLCSLETDSALMWGKEKILSYFCLWQHDCAFLLYTGTHITKVGSEKQDLLMHWFTGACLRRGRVSRSHELSVKEAWVLFSSPIFAGCIHFLEALLTVQLDFTAMPQQAGTEGKEGNPEPSSIHAQRAWPCSTTGTTVSWETWFGRWKHYLFKVFTPQLNFHISVSL